MLTYKTRGTFPPARASKAGFPPPETRSMFRKFAALYALVRQDIHTLWHALRHPARPAWLRPALALLALYLLSPVDLIPDVLPVIGIVDDLVLIPLVISWMVRLLPEALKRDRASLSRALARKA